MSASRAALARQLLIGYEQDLEDGNGTCTDSRLLLVIATALVSIAEDNHGGKRL